MLRVVAPGALTLVQDGHARHAAHLGVGRGGALDPVALAAANVAVGNPPDAAGLETVLDGLVLEALEACMVAVAGVGGDVTPIAMDAGDTLTVVGDDAGLRRYVAVRGGVDAPRALGSASSDLFAALGAAPLRVGDLVRVAGAATDYPSVVEDPPLPGAAGATVRVHTGPQHDWCDPDALVQSPWVLDPASDRTAARLSGGAIVRAVDDEVAPLGILPGAVQLPASGLPIVFLHDHPVTGGYPVIGVVDAADLRLVGQLRPGRALRFVRA